MAGPDEIHDGISKKTKESFCRCCAAVIACWSGDGSCKIAEQVKGWLHRQAHFLEIVLKVLHKGLNAVFAAEFRIDG
jgi:hypothetical protein